MKSKVPYLGLAAVVLILDQITKWLAESRLLEYRPVEIIPGFLNLTLVRNTGVAFGLFASGGSFVGTALLILVGLFALGVVGVFFHRTPSEERLLLTALGLVLGGAVGNLADRILSGAVTDFIDFYWGTYHFHTFNIADSAITVGVVFLILDMLLDRRKTRGLEAAEAPPDKPGEGSLEETAG